MCSLMNRCASLIKLLDGAFLLSPSQPLIHMFRGLCFCYELMYVWTAQIIYISSHLSHPIMRHLRRLHLHLHFHSIRHLLYLRLQLHLSSSIFHLPSSSLYPLIPSPPIRFAFPFPFLLSPFLRAPVPLRLPLSSCPRKRRKEKRKRIIQLWYGQGRA